MAVNTDAHLRRIAIAQERQADAAEREAHATERRVWHKMVELWLWGASLVSGTGLLAWGIWTAHKLFG